MIGAPIAIVQAMTTSICTCCTSLVIRVISDGAPNEPDLPGREAGDRVEQGAAHVAAEAHGHLGAEVDGGDGEDDLDEREAEHDRAGRADVALVVLEDAVVDDAGVEGRQGQRGCRLHGLEDEDAEQDPLVRA